MKKLALALALVLCLLPGLALADVSIRSGATSDLASVNTNKALLVNEGASTRTSYIASASGLVTTALFNMSLEAGGVIGFKVSSICVGVSNATASSLVTITLQRRTTASTGGTAMTIEGTATPAISKMDPSAANFSGLGRVTATLGTAGPILDQWGYQGGPVASSTSQAPFCKVYGLSGAQLPIVLPGVANGISVNVSAPGAGGLASGSISITFISE
jgi:hypothetical protein